MVHIRRLFSKLLLTPPEVTEIVNELKTPADVSPRCCSKIRNSSAPIIPKHHHHHHHQQEVGVDVLLLNTNNNHNTSHTKVIKLTEGELHELIANKGVVTVNICNSKGEVVPRTLDFSLRRTRCASQF